MHAEADRAQREAVRAMSVEAKLLAAESLRAFAWELKRSVIRREHPHLSESEILEQVRALFHDDAS